MRIQLQKYSPAAFACLNDFESSKQLLLQNQQHIEKLGEVIRTFGFERHLGVCLLHKHFDLASDEVLVERIESKSSIIKPGPLSMKRDALPYMWCLANFDDNTKRWVPLEFAVRQSVEQEHLEFVAGLSSADEFFQALTDILVTFGIQNVFGISLHHRSRIDFDRSEQLLLETDSHSERYMLIEPVRRVRATQPDWTQTLWRFPKHGNAVAEAECSDHGCAGHCAAHG